MSDGQDFTIDAGDRETAAGPMPAPPPLVVIQYRNRGLPAVLVPPAMIVMAALAILSYQRLTPARRPDRATALGDPARPRPGRTILVEPPSSGVAIGPIVVRGESSSPAATTSPVTAAVEAAPKVAPGNEDLSPLDLVASAGRRPVEPPPAPSRRRTGLPPSRPTPPHPGRLPERTRDRPWRRIWGRTRIRPRPRAPRSPGGPNGPRSDSNPRRPSRPTCSSRPSPSRPGRSPSRPRKRSWPRSVARPPRKRPIAGSWRP